MALGAGKPRMALCPAEADLLASALLARKAKSVRVRKGGLRQARDRVGGPLASKEHQRKLWRPFAPGC
jgi:hypothetical protein